MRTSSLVSLIVALSAAGVGQTPSPASPAPTAQVQAMVPFGTQIRKTVVFIELLCKEGNKLFTVKGTGFLVGVEVPEISKESKIAYLVTNRHVAFCWNDKNQPMEVVSISIRGNLKEGRAISAPLNPNGNAPWTVPKDDSVDLAVCPFSPSDQADALVVPLSMFATKEVLHQKGVVEGARIVFTGFFYQFPGELRIQPIVREGILAMVPDEPLKTASGKPGNVYLGDVHIFHGNSGSPVFVDVQTGFGTPNYELLGVVSGNFSEDQDFNLEIDTTIRGTEHANSGIAVIVPADALKSLIEDDPILKAQRASVIAAFSKAK